MPLSNLGLGKWSAGCAVLLSAAALLSAAPAAADPTDDAFVAALAKDGITTDRNTAIALAHKVCGGFDKNEKSSLLVMKLMKDTDLSLKQSSYFVGASMSAYCPQYAGLTDNSANWLNPGPPLM
jgi:Protein of unknown function (DUF732)